MIRLEPDEEVAAGRGVRSRKSLATVTADLEAKVQVHCKDDDKYQDRFKTIGAMS
jgi:hypothetical protein